MKITNARIDAELDRRHNLGTPFPRASPHYNLEKSPHSHRSWHVRDTTLIGGVESAVVGGSLYSRADVALNSRTAACPGLRPCGMQPVEPKSWFVRGCFCRGVSAGMQGPGNVSDYDSQRR